MNSLSAWARARLFGGRRSPARHARYGGRPVDVRLRTLMRPRTCDEWRLP